MYTKDIVVFFVSMLLGLYAWRKGIKILNIGQERGITTISWWLWRGILVNGILGLAMWLILSLVFQKMSVGMESTSSDRWLLLSNVGAGVCMCFLCFMATPFLIRRQKKLPNTIDTIGGSTFLETAKATAGRKNYPFLFVFRPPGFTSFCPHFSKDLAAEVSTLDETEVVIRWALTMGITNQDRMHRLRQDIMTEWDNSPAKEAPQKEFVESYQPNVKRCMHDICVYFSPTILVRSPIPAILEKVIELAYDDNLINREQADQLKGELREDRLLNSNA